MEKGYFWHVLPNTVPTICSVGWFRINNPENPKLEEAGFKVAWDGARGIKRGIYQVPKLVGTSITVADNVSFALQHISNYAGGQSVVKEAPYMFRAEYNMNLTQINEYLGYLWDEILNISGAKRPLMLISAGRWKEIQKGDNAPNVSKWIADKTDVCLIDYKAELPPLELTPKIAVKAWNYDPGFLQWADGGDFQKIEYNTPPDNTTPAPSGTAKEIIHICPHCGGRLLY